MSKTTLNAVVISVGDELLAGKIEDTNATFLSSWLYQRGISVVARYTCSDAKSDIEVTLKIAGKKADLLFITGGLGPTHDDVTAQAVADYLKKPLVFSDRMWKEIQAFFEKRNLVSHETNRKQAYAPSGAEWIPNNKGTAPGFCSQEDERLLFVLPGPPRENIPMIKTWIGDKLDSKGLSDKPLRHVFRIYGSGESQLALYMENISIKSQYGCYFKQTGWIELHFSTTDICEKDFFDEMEKIHSYLTSKGLSLTEDKHLSQLVQEEAIKKNLTIGFAESITGGLTSGMLVNNPGASDAFKGSIVAYRNEAKENLLMVNHTTLDQFGAVSEETAREMATGAAKILGTEVTAAVTGIAGPAGGTEEKPVGTVCFAFLIKGTLYSVTKTFTGDRQRIINRCSNFIFLELYRKLAQEV